MKAFKARSLACGVAVACISLLTPAYGVTVRTVMSGLNSPRGLAIGPQGAIYVAEAGAGGPYSMVVDGTTYTYGLTGSISRYFKGSQQRVVTGLPSINGAEGLAGPSDVGFQGLGNGYATIGLGASPLVRAALGATARDLGSLIRFTPNGRWSVVADLAGYEQNANPDGGATDTNPYGLSAGPEGVSVADAGGNDVLSVSHRGTIHTAAVFPVVFLPLPSPPFPAGQQAPMQAVPTSVTRGPDGALYVGQLTGFPFPSGGASIYRIVPGQAPTVVASGFTTIIGIAFGPDGSLYVLQYASGSLMSGPGSLVKVSPNGTRTTLLDNLADTTGLAVDKTGAVYLSSGAFKLGDGVVVRVTF